ncbi:MAG TPA: hypothetical protein VF784_17755, partial [Anaerolineales bacterium]
MRLISSFAHSFVAFIFALSLGAQDFRPAQAERSQLSSSNKANTGGIPAELGQPVQPAEFRGDLRNLPQVKSIGPHRQSRLLSPGRMPAKQPTASSFAPNAQTQIPSLNMPAPATTFKGLDELNWGSGWPPDPNGDVGPDYYVQAVNTSIGIFNKSTGVRVAAFTFDSFWSGIGSTPCNGNNQGDPIVLYDPLAARWIFADFAFGVDIHSNPYSPYYECFAVSETSDPLSGGWWMYAVRTDDASHPWMADYPKLGLWPDGIYMSANMFDSSNTFQGVRAWAFNRSDMESGANLRWYQAAVGTDYFTMLPSNLRGALPPSGTPNYFVTNNFNLPQWGLDVWKFQVNWGTSANFTHAATVVTPGWFWANSNVVPEMGGETLDSLGNRLMMQNQYRNINGTESLWLTDTVSSDTNGVGPTGIHWYQVNVTGGAVATTAVQVSTFQPADGSYRWMPSLAVDNSGDMAVGYSVSSSSMYPAIRYAGRLATDSPNTLGQGETTLIAGTGSQSGGYGRWGDYTAMTVDPTDDCTFWYTNEYYETTGGNWQTRIGSFKFPSCTPVSRVIKISGNTTISGVTLSVNGTVVATSDGSGNYAFNEPSAWSGTVTPSKPGYTFDPPSRSYTGVTTDLTTQNFTAFANNVDVYVGGSKVGDYYVSSGGRVTPQYSLMNGPAQVVSTDASSIFTSQRVHNATGFVNELMGIPLNQMTHAYWFPWYDNLNMITWILIGNPDPINTAHVDVFIAKNQVGHYDIPPGRRVT